MYCDIQRQLRFAILAFLTALVAGSAPVSEASAPVSVNLALMLDAEQTHRFEYSVKSTQTMSAFGRDQTSQAEMDATIDLVRLPAERTDGHMTIGVTYQRLRLSIDGGQLPGAFDSQNPLDTDQGNVYAQICRPLVGSQLRLVVDPRGSIKQVEGLDELAPEGLAGALFGQLFGPDASKAMFQPLLRIIDDGAPNRARGDEWQLQRPAVPSLGVPASEVQLRVTGIQRDTWIAEINVSGEPRAELPADAAVLPNVETKKSSLTGQILWNGQLGILESMRTEAVTEMVSEAQGISIAVKSESTTRVKRVSP